MCIFSYISLSSSSQVSCLLEQSPLATWASLYISVGRYADADKLLAQSLKEKQLQFSTKSRHLNSPLILSSKLRLVKGDYSEACKVNDPILFHYFLRSVKMLFSMTEYSNSITRHYMLTSSLLLSGNISLQ